jgi:glycosyltransferase involved in cell wall biosynthesis
MNIAYVCADFGIPVHGAKGASVHVRELSQALKALGHEVDIYTPRAGGLAPDGFAVPVHEIRPASAEKHVFGLLRDDPAGGEPAAKEIRSLLYASMLRRELSDRFRNRPPDVIYERYALLASAGSELADELGIPHVLEVNAPLSSEQAEHRGVQFGQTIRAMERRILTRATTVIAVSAPVREWLTRAGVSPDRITVMPNGVDAECFAQGTAGAAEIRRRLRVGTRPVVGFVGTLKAWHGTATMLRAFAEVTAARVEAGRPHLLIVGDGPQRVELEALAAQLGVAGDVTFAGTVLHSEMPAWVAAMDIAVAPYDDITSHYFSPLKLFEYMASGRPIVAAAIGQVPDCIDDGETGLLYAPGEVAAQAAAIRFLLDHPSRAAAMGRAAQAVARTRYTWAGNARMVVDLATAGQPGAEMVRLGRGA